MRSSGQNECSKIDLFLTFDYELYFVRTGTAANCLLKPTRALAQVMQPLGVKATFFVDALYYLRMWEQNGSTRAECEAISEQLSHLIEQGHRIELHLHPSWRYATWRQGQWRVPVDHTYRLHGLSDREILDSFVTGSQFLQELARRVDRDYEVQAFRAGGLCVQPFQRIAAAFREAGLHIDSSMAPGMAANTDTHVFDFEGCAFAFPYRFSHDPMRRDPSGDLMELPITTYERTWLHKVAYRSAALYAPDKYRPCGDGQGLQRPAHLRRKLSATRSVLSLDDTTPAIMTRLLTPSSQVSSTSPLCFTILSHTKQLSPAGLDAITRIARSGRYRFRLVHIEELSALAR